MNKKICVYAIAKNEIKFIERWYESVKEADYVCVLDTGSTDGSFEKFKALGIICEQKCYDNFRFDIARNDSLKLIPTDADICVCVDIDEFFEAGWTQTLRNVWNEKIGRVRYRYTWNFNPDGSEGTVFMADKIHKNGAYIWTHPVHEILTEISHSHLQTVDAPNIQLNHRADNTKSRSNYLPLLELSVKEDPLDDRNMHYLAREYMFHGEYKKAIQTFKKHLSLPSAVWEEERCASLRYIAHCYKQLGILKQHSTFEKNKQKYNKNLNNLTKIVKKPIKNTKNKKNDNIFLENNRQDDSNLIKNKIVNNYYFNKQINYLQLAILTCNTTREPYFDLAQAYFENNNYILSALWFNEMFKITKRELNYISNPTCWGALPYDYLSMCYYYLGDYRSAFITVTEALKFGKDGRLENNQKIFADLCNNQKRD